MPRERFGYEGDLRQEPEHILAELRERSRQNATINPFTRGCQVKTGMYFSTLDLLKEYGCKTILELKAAMEKDKIFTDTMDEEATRIRRVGNRKITK